VQQTLAAPVPDAPAVRALQSIITRAVEMRASDVHLEPRRDGGRIRLRIDGMLREIETLDEALYLPVVSRVKLLGGMDIADRRQPQDGRYTVECAGRTLDARISSMPTLDGEKIVVRLFDVQARAPRLDELGMRAQILERYRRLIASPYGFLIVTGPTGSGKTTTLYSTLREIADHTRSICTVEDPVEMRLDGISQVNVNARAGLGFATVLRSFLRQDPNVIMVGEMRDTETASVAVAAALSGQLVLTTLHSNDAPRTIERLIELGQARHAIAAALFGIASQRLVRRLCGACRRPAPKPATWPPGAAEAPYAPVGCDDCGGTGYLGRIALFELLEIDDAVRDAITANASVVAIRELGKRRGYEPLFLDGLAKVASGQTTADEVRRVAAWPG
jgi:type II secretory ATPase GspE/PulE/Tfp pilus assembly ATPase PilB-like protein